MPSWRNRKQCTNSVTSCILRNCKYRDYLVSNRRLHMLCYSCRARSGTRETLSRTQRRVATKTLSFQTPSKSNSPTWRLPSTLTAKTCNASRRTERTTYAYTRQTQHYRRCSITSSRASLWTCPCAESHPRWPAPSKSTKKLLKMLLTLKQNQKQSLRSSSPKPHNLAKLRWKWLKLPQKRLERQVRHVYKPLRLSSRHTRSAKLLKSYQSHSPGLVITSLVL